MHIRIITAVLMIILALPIYAQHTDSIKTIELENVDITSDSFSKYSKRNSALSTDVAGKDFLDKHFTGTLMQTLEHMSGVRSMDIGSGFSKPMIRGMAFNRISVIENGVKQEGQQWGSDHGLEIDAFNVERVTVRKGPSSLLYGSDAMGGAIEISQPLAPNQNQIFGEATFLGKSANSGLSGSVLFGLKKDNLYTKFRYTEQRFGDYKIPTDTIVYLTYKIPIYGRKLKNTAGIERNVSSYTEYRNGRYSSFYTISNAYQKVGFFPGAHGIPDLSRVKDDGDSRNIDLPYSKVNHMKLSSQQQYAWDEIMGSWNIGFQNNHREEWSEFHTHYETQSPPANNPDKELAFNLNTYSSSLKVKAISSSVEYNAGWDLQYQHNSIGGYSFLLPRYDRFATGVFSFATWRPSNDLMLSGGLRYDYGNLNISGYSDPYLGAYLQEMGYADDFIEQYEWRSYPVKRHFGNLSGSLGLVWEVGKNHLLKANIGRSFRLPSANELASNGVHHGAFRHEQGDPTLDSEKGWQLDASYEYDDNGLSLSVNPFASRFSNYIHLSPTGEWSVLPHAGQIYRYVGTRASFVGAEISLSIDILPCLNYALSGEYVYTQNIDAATALSFSPPPSMRNTLTWKIRNSYVYGELYSIASQNRIAKNESRTSGANLINLGGSTKVSVGNTVVEVNLSIRNMMNTKYYNHLSFYRKVEIPEPGRNFQLLVKIPFKSNLK